MCTMLLTDSAVGPGVWGTGSKTVAARSSEDGDSRNPNSERLG